MTPSVAELLAIDLAPVYQEWFEEPWEGGWCVPTAATLELVFEEMGWRGRASAVDARVFPHEQTRYCSTLTQERHTKGGIGGHLVMVSDSGWMLDPSITQVNSTNGPRVEPVLLWLPRAQEKYGMIYVEQEFDHIQYRPQQKPFKLVRKCVDRAKGHFETKQLSRIIIEKVETQLEKEGLL